jgi:hypothetical protein
MGLDGVELVMRIEKYFGIDIPNRQAATMTTVQQTVDVVAEHLQVTDNSTELRDRVFNKLQSAIPNSSIGLNDPISKHISIDEESWANLKDKLQLNIYIPERKREEKRNWWDKAIGNFTIHPTYDVDTLTIEQLVNAICACNYETFIDNKNIKSRYEIYVAVSGIAMDQCGVDCYEIAPEKSFANDFGID